MGSIIQHDLAVAYCVSVNKNTSLVEVETIDHRQKKGIDAISITP